MVNFKQIAEDCLAGKLSGTFFTLEGKGFSSNKLTSYWEKPYPYYIEGVGVVNENGNHPVLTERNIVGFIPNKHNIQKGQIKIDVPEGKVPVMEQTKNGVVITWKEKELTYNDIEAKLPLHTKIQTQYFWDINVNECCFSTKINVIRKLINIRNHFGQCDKTKRGYHICQDINYYDYSCKFIVRELCINDPHEVVFAKKEHAEQAIKMLGDELKYLFEPW